MKVLSAGLILSFAAFAQAPVPVGSIFQSELARSLPRADSVSVSVESVTNGASFQPGIEAGSWVQIKGSNLANTNPGRIWRADERASW